MTLRYTCCCCRREYKTEPSKGQQITGGICSAYCRQSMRLWVAMPAELRTTLYAFHRQREKVQGVA